MHEALFLQRFLRFNSFGWTGTLRSYSWTLELNCSCRLNTRSKQMNVQVEVKSEFKVWGRIDGKRFEQVFQSVKEWRAERRLIERQFSVEVAGMASV
jgi:hypothetical protein